MESDEDVRSPLTSPEGNRKTTPSNPAESGTSTGNNKMREYLLHKKQALYDDFDLETI